MRATLAIERERLRQSGCELLVESLALALEASLVVRHAPPAVADAFCASRLEGDGGRTFGTLPASADLAAIIRRAWPE